MKSTVYVETSLPSFYYEVRTEPEMVARKRWTQQWWKECSEDYLLVTSVAVLNELGEGAYPGRNRALALMRNLRLVAVEPPIPDIVQAYITHKVMPLDPVGDAMHLALASYHKCDFLLTWNCHHLANANKFSHIRRVNALLGLYVPALVTPLEMLGGRDIYER